MITRRSVRIGLGLFVLGLVFIAVDVIPFFFDDHNRPLWLNLACLCAPIGFAIAVWSGISAGRAEQRAAAAALAGEAGSTATSTGSTWHTGLSASPLSEPSQREGI